jgi:sugar-specific transcriptional regulator TrmB
MNSEIASLFKELGLTQYESNALTTLLERGELKAADVGRLAEVPKTRIYDILDKLVEKGFIINVGTSPKRYKVIDVNLVFEKLLEEKRSQLQILESKISEIMSRLEITSRNDDRILKVKGRNDALEVIKEEVSKANKEIKGFTDIAHYKLQKAFKDAKAKNPDVSIKLIGHINKDELQEKYGNLAEIKSYPHEGLNAFVIDGKKLVLTLTGKEENEQHNLAIYVKDSAMIKNFSNYFDNVWEKV